MEELGRGAYGKVHKAVLTPPLGVEVFLKPKEERVEIKEGKIVAVKTLLGTNLHDVVLVLVENETALGLNCASDSAVLSEYWAGFAQQTN